MFTFTCDFKVNNTVIKTVDLDADILLKELNKQQYTQLTQKGTDKPLYTKTEQDDIARNVSWIWFARQYATAGIFKSK